jgi:LmbE family N-acetylglucosaminyl deacetylase
MRKSHQGYTLLAVLAHPDDESFGLGGTLAYYAERGVEVHLICATRGEAGEVGPEYLEGYESIADLREAELDCAAQHLGIDEIHFLDYRDSGMSGAAREQHPRSLVCAPQEEVVRQVVEIIRGIKPEVVITFDPIGGYHHPDHIYIHEVTRKAFQKAGDPEYMADSPPYMPKKLYYHTISKRYLRFRVRLLRFLGRDPSRWGKNKDIDLTAIIKEDFPIHARIDVRSVEDRKEAAAACHASQSGSSLTGTFINWLLNIVRIRGRDLFMRAYPEPQAGEMESDLFAGLG